MNPATKFPAMRWQKWACALPTIAWTWNAVFLTQGPKRGFKFEATRNSMVSGSLGGSRFERFESKVAVRAQKAQKSKKTTAERARNSERSRKILLRRGSMSHVINLSGPGSGRLSSTHWRFSQSGSPANCLNLRDL